MTCGQVSSTFGLLFWKAYGTCKARLRGPIVHNSLPCVLDTFRLRGGHGNSSIPFRSVWIGLEGEHASEPEEHPICLRLRPLPHHRQLPWTGGPDCSSSLAAYHTSSNLRGRRDDVSKNLGNRNYRGIPTGNPWNPVVATPWPTETVLSHSLPPSLAESPCLLVVDDEELLAACVVAPR